MSTTENKELVRRFVQEVFVEGRVESVEALVADEFVSHTWGPAGSGKADLERATARMAGVLADVAFSVEDIIAEDDRVAVRLTASATQVGELMGLPASGKRYTIGEIHIFRIAEGRIVEHWHQYDQPAMLRQLGATDS
jgi:steroid delta-isomerase-like uncharacterized protein